MTRVCAATEVEQEQHQQHLHTIDTQVTAVNGRSFIDYFSGHSSIIQRQQQLTMPNVESLCNAKISAL